MRVVHRHMMDNNKGVCQRLYYGSHRNSYKTSCDGGLPCHQTHQHLWPPCQSSAACLGVPHLVELLFAILSLGLSGQSAQAGFARCASATWPVCSASEPRETAARTAKVVDATYCVSKSAAPALQLAMCFTGQPRVRKWVLMENNSRSACHSSWQDFLIHLRDCVFFISLKYLQPVCSDEVVKFKKERFNLFTPCRIHFFIFK